MVHNQSKNTRLHKNGLNRTLATAVELGFGKILKKKIERKEKKKVIKFL